MIIKGVIRRVRFGHDSMPPRVGNWPTLRYTRNEQCKHNSYQIHYTHLGYGKEEKALSQFFLKA